MASPKSVDAALWWDPFTSLLTELQNASLSFPLPPDLAKKLKENHAWFLDTVSCFKQPSANSKEALNWPQLKIGSHELTVKPELKDKALHISSYLGLDEVQSYILVERSLESNNLALDSAVEEYLHVILLNYYVERQCLLKCTRWIIMHTLYVGIGSNEGNIVKEEVVKLISDGFQSKLISVLQDLLTSCHPEQMDVDLFTLWAEETLIEDNLVLDILFLIYYESLCTCNGETWKKLFSIYKGILSGTYNFGKLAVSSEALKCCYHAKIQLLLILIETLDLENLLQLVHDDIPFRQGASIFSLTDIQQMDTLISSFDTFEMKEAGPLILTWAVCLCLISSLPRKEEINLLMEIDHVGYVRQAFDGSTLSYFIEILESEILNDSEGPVVGYRSVLRTFVSAFIASYEINLQLEDSTFNQILDILCKIYRGEESLCVQFWDKESFVDGPIRCLLCNLEGEFPFRTTELIRLLSSLCEGSWPAECVYKFLNESVGVSSLFEITSESLVDEISQIVETHQPVRIPGVESMFVPSNTRGHILKVIGGNTALVRWEYTQSGVCILLLRLAQQLYTESNEEVFLTLDLLSRMVSFNPALSFALMDIGNSFYFQAQESELSGLIEKNLWVVEIICTVIKNLSPNSSSAILMSVGINILTKMLKCAPYQVTAVALKANIFEMALKARNFDVGNVDPLSGSWLLSGKLAKMFLIDSEQNDCDNPLAISVMDFTKQLVESRVENDFVLALVVFSLQYVLINHEYWKYKVKHLRWKVTLKVLEVMKTCIMSVSFLEKVGVIIRDLLLSDSSIHNVLLRLACTTKQTLENICFSRLFEPTDIEGYQHAIGSALEILYSMLSKLSKDTSPSLSVFHQALLSSATKPVPIVAAVISLISFFQDPAIQASAARVLSMLIIADYQQPYLSGKMCFGLDDKQITDLRGSVKCILLEQLERNEDLFVEIINLLISAARYQPALFVAIFDLQDNAEVQLSNVISVKQSTNEAPNSSPGCKKSSLLDTFMQHIERSDEFINSKPRILLLVFDFLNALWQGAVNYIKALEYLKSSGNLWKQLSNCISINDSWKPWSVEHLTESEAQSLACKYHCHAAILEIIGYDIFVNKKLLHAESCSIEVSKCKESTENPVSTEKSKSPNFYGSKDTFSSWCEGSILGNLIKLYTYCEYDNKICYRAKVAASLFVVHVMAKLVTGNSGSLSVSLLEKISITYKNLSCQPCFLELVAKYSQRGYCEGNELRSLILNDLYYHLQGELEGRTISPGTFKELSQYVIESNCLQIYWRNCNNEYSASVKDVYLYDIAHIRADMGLDAWDHTEWKASKDIAEKTLAYMQEVNSMVLLTRSKLSALRALLTVLTVYEENSPDNWEATVRKIPNQLCFSCIGHICQCFHAQVGSLAHFSDASEEVLDFLTAQAELLLHLIKSAQSSLSLSVHLPVLKASCSGLKVLSDFQSSAPQVRKTVKLLLMLLLLALELGNTSDKETEDFAEVSNACLALLPILCKCISTTEHSALSLTIIDLVLRTFLTPNTWFPIIQKHLQLQHVILKLEDKKSIATIPMTLKFLLTLSRVKGGAEMLLNAGFLSSLGVLFADLVDGEHSAVIINSKGLPRSPDATEKPLNIWGIGLAVVTSMVHSLENSSSCMDIMDYIIANFFSEKAYLVSYYLNAPDFPSDDQEKKRPRVLRTQTSLTALEETEHTLLLMCTLAKHWSSWVKATKEVDSKLREKSIHLLAFISRGTHRHGESPSRTAPLICPPILKEEFELCKKPSFLTSRNGWFALSPLCCVSKPKFSAVPSSAASLIIKGQSSEKSNPVSPTHFSDLVGQQIYKITFLLLKFLCLEAHGAAKRSEEVGFVDLAHIPELPMPEILHGLQDQAIAIISELCDLNRPKNDQPEIESVCLLLFHILEMALYLEHFVLQICRIRPVLGRVEDFSKEVKLLMKATEGHAFLKASLRSLKRIISSIYPGLLQTEGFL